MMCSLCCLQQAHAQKYGFLNYTTDNGLAQSQVLAMCQDDYGYLWFSTYGGVSRFDGVEFINYTVSDSLLSNRTRSLFKDSKGRLWLGTQDGYSVFEKGRFSKHFISTRGENFGDIIYITETSDGSYWLFSERKYVIHIKGKGKPGIFYNDDDKVGQVLSVTMADDIFYLATDNGVVKFDPVTKKFNAEETLGRGKKCSYITYHNKRFYLAVFYEGLFVYQNGHELINLTQARNGLTSNSVRHLFFDREGLLWASTSDGVSIIDVEKGYRVTPLKENNGLPNSNITFTGQDNEGNIWFGADAGGIIKFIGKSVINYNYTTMSILQERNGTLWFGTYNDGVYSYKDNVFTHYNYELNDLAGDLVWSLAQTTDGRIWMGTSTGLSVFDPKKKSKMIERSYYTTDGLLDDKITSLYADANGMLWIGNRNGLNSFYNGKIESYGEEAGITGGNIRCIIPDKKGNLWLAGSSGLFKFNKRTGKARIYRYRAVNKEYTIYSLRFDQAGNLWVGTKDGVYILKDEKLKPLEHTNIDIAGNINFLMDDQDIMWIGNNFGIFELNLKTYYEKDTAILRAYGRNEGMVSRETNLNAVYKDRSNNLWFGTDKGLVKLGPKRFEADTKSPPFVHIDNVEIFLKRPDWKKISSYPLNDFGFPAKAEKIKYNQNHITFYYTGISHTQPQNIRYSYMLEGYNNDWLPLTETRDVTYSNLAPGSYRFKVRAQNANGLWSAEPAVFDFVIVAPFWQTWWFYSACAVFVILVIIGLWRLRLSQIKRKNQTMQLYYKSKLLSFEQQSLNASMNRHFIFNSLNSIQYYINKQDKLEANRYLTNFAKLIRKNLDSSISSDLIPLAEELERIELYLSLETMRFKDRFRYTFNIDKAINPELIMIPPMLFQPYIENSIWHGILPKEEEGHIVINIYPNPTDASLVNIEILDDGIGVSTSLKNRVETGSTHISRGIEITSGRLNLLKEMTQQNLEIIGPEDITDPSGKVTGTSVKLVISVKIPLKAEKSEDKLYEK